MRVLTADEVAKVSGADYGRCVQNWAMAGRTAGTVGGTLAGGVLCEPLGGGGGAACRSALGYIGGTVGEKIGSELGQAYCATPVEGGIFSSNGNLDNWDPPEAPAEPDIGYPAASLDALGVDALEPLTMRVC